MRTSRASSATRPAGRSALEITDVCYLGTSVEGGSAAAVVVATGLATFSGGVSASLVEAQGPTSFDRGVARFTRLMIGFIAVLAPLVFVINGVTKGDRAEAFIFAMAAAVGLTPEMLPMVVAVCLSKGTLAMSRQKVVVKRPTAIQNLGLVPDDSARGGRTPRRRFEFRVAGARHVFRACRDSLSWGIVPAGVVLSGVVAASVGAAVLSRPPPTPASIAGSARGAL